MINYIEKNYSSLSQIENWAELCRMHTAFHMIDSYVKAKGLHVKDIYTKCGLGEKTISNWQKPDNVFKLIEPKTLEKILYVFPDMLEFVPPHIILKSVSAMSMADEPIHVYSPDFIKRIPSSELLNNDVEITIKLKPKAK